MDAHAALRLVAQRPLQRSMATDFPRPAPGRARPHGGGFYQKPS